MKLVAYLFMDSLVAVHWMVNYDSYLHIFQTNRVAAILSVFSSNFYHVSPPENGWKKGFIPAIELNIIISASSQGKDTDLTPDLLDAYRSGVILFKYMDHLSKATAPGNSCIVRVSEGTQPSILIQQANVLITAENLTLQTTDCFPDLSGRATQWLKGTRDRQHTRERILYFFILLLRPSPGYVELGHLSYLISPSLRSEISVKIMLRRNFPH